MKQTFLFLASAVLLAACTQSPAPNKDLSAENGLGTLRVTLSDPSAGTKALQSTFRESAINSLQVFVFDQESGKRETDRYESPVRDANGTYSMTLTTLTGTKQVWAVVNAPRVSGIPDVETLRKSLSDLADNSPVSLVMSGWKTGVEVLENDPNASGALEPSHADIGVRRLGARIALQGVTVDFTGTELEGARFTIKALYLKNVLGKARLGQDSCEEPIEKGLAANWYNLFRQSAVTAAPAAIQALTLDSALSLECNTAGTSRELGYAWYVYPNPTTSADDHTAGNDLPRMTRLVLQAHLSGTAVGGSLDEDCWYVFSLPDIQGNHIYNVSDIRITLRGKPDDDDDTTTTSGKLSASVEVQDWSGTTSLSYDL